MANFCKNCGTELKEGNVCQNCGTVNGTPANVNTNAQAVGTPKKNNGFAIAGFVVSLVSILFCGSTSIISLVLSIVGAVKSKKIGSGKGLAIAGIIISAIFFIAFIIISSTIGLAAVAAIIEGTSSSSSYYNYY